MSGTKFNRLLSNKFFYTYKNSQDSIIPTYHFQKSLTKLKIPKLDDTFERYLTALKPILNEADWKKAEEIARKFQSTEAPLLDKEIRDLDNQDKDGNYISEPWFDMYLRARDPIVLNYNPFIAFISDPNLAQMNQAIRASNMLISSVRFMNSLRSNKLKPEIFHLNPEKSDTLLFQRLMRYTPESFAFYAAYMFNAFPLDMSQYHRLFNSTRIPKKGKDILITDETNNNIFVIHNGNYYVFPVIDSDGNIFEPDEILACFHHILKMDHPEPEYALGCLTAENRDTWAEVREHLEKLGNKEALKLIDTSLYCIALDNLKSDDPDVLSANFLHGNHKNRWFDKNHTLIITRNGQAAINFEHSWGDGVAVLRFFNEKFDDSTSRPYVTCRTLPSMHHGKISEYVKKIEFNLDDKVKSAIKRAEKKYEDSVSSVHIRNFVNDLYGRSFVKEFGLSPDSLMQTAFQIAYYKCFNNFVSTYESASTSAFKYGRTETIRPATMETRRLAEYMKKKDGLEDPNEVLSILKQATSKHNKLVKDAAMGQGFDRHLFALKYHAETRKQMSTPEFYKSDAYKFLNHNILSTSTLAYPNILTGGFAPVVSDGLGVGYRILDKTLGSSVSCYDHSKLTMFVSTLQETFDRLYKILNKADKPKPRKS